MVAVGLDRSFVQGDHFMGIAAQGRHRGGPLSQILGGLLDGAGERVQHLQRGGGIFGITEGLGPAQGALARVVARLLGRRVALQRRLVFLPGEMTLGQIIAGHGAAVGLSQHLDRSIISPQQIQTNAEPHVAGRRLILSTLQLADCVAQDGVLREIACDQLLHQPDFARTERIVLQDGLLHVEFDGLRHYGQLLIRCGKRL